MPKTYEPADPEVEARVKTLLDEFHPRLVNIGVRIDLIYAMNPDGDAVTHQGYKALAVVKKLPLLDRAMHRGDAQIVIDRDAYLRMPHEERDALLDHELYHIELVPDDDGKTYKLDDLGRPVLRLKKHDVQVGWFQEVAVRHGRHAMEVKQAKEVFVEYHQSFFAFIEDYKIGLGPATAPTQGRLEGVDTVTISTGATSVTVTGEQLAKAAKTLGKKGGKK